MSMRAVNSLRYNATYEDYDDYDDFAREESFDPREDSGTYSVPHPEDEDAFRSGDHIDGLDDEFQDDREYYDEYDDYVSEQGSEAEEWGFEFAQDESPGEPPQSQLYGRTANLGPTGSNASTVASGSAPPRGPTPLTYPPLPTSAPADYASFGASTNQRDSDARAREGPADLENVNPGAGVRPFAVGEVEAAFDKTGSSKKQDRRQGSKGYGTKPVQDNFNLDDSRADDPLSDARPRPPPLTQVHEPREKKKTSVGSFLRSARSNSQPTRKNAAASDSPPKSPRPKGSGKPGPKRSPSNSSGKGSPMSSSSGDRGSSPAGSVNSSPRNSKGRRSPNGKTKSSKKQDGKTKSFRQRDRRPCRERAMSFVCEVPEKYVRNLPARCPCFCIFISFGIVAAIISVGLVFNFPEVDTDLHSLMKTVVNSSVTHDAFVAAVGAIRESYGGRRLQSQSIAAYVHSDIYLAYELKEGSPHKSVTDFEVMLKIGQFEHGLRTLPEWTDECERTDVDFRDFCNPGISMANVMLPTLQMNSGSVLPSALRLNGKGQDPLPMPSVMYLLNQYGTREVVLPKEFDTSSPDGGIEAFRSAFFFKVPVGTSLDSASVLSESVKNVRERWKDFMKNAVFPYLDSAKEQLEGIEVYYTGSNIQGLEVMNTLMKDLMWAIGSLVFVLVYLVLHTRSIIASVLGLIIIVVSVPLGMVTFLLIASSNSVNIASFLSMFLVVGLGADVVFVYTDFWRDSAYVSKDLTYRAIWTYKHAGKTSLATTVTTALSFFANIASVLRSLRDFGMFMGLCVVYVWVTVSLIYMPVLIFIERCKCSCGVERCVNFLFVCCPNRPRIFQRWVRRANQCKLFLFCSAVLLGLVALIAALAQVESDMATPNIFPKGHNQHRGVEVLNYFSAPAELEYVAKVDVQPPPLEVDVCSDWTFAEMLPCSLFWCEAVPGVQQQKHEQCTCYHKFHSTCGNGFTSSMTRLVGTGIAQANEDLIEIANQHLRNETSGTISMHNAIVKRSRPPMVIERWETGDSIINSVVDIAYDTLADHTDNHCGWNALCFCGQSICKKQASWKESTAAPVPTRRLQSTAPERVSQWPPVFPRHLGQVPAGQRASVDVAFGLLVDPSIPLFGEKASDEQWSFLQSYQPGHPRAQRDMYTLCTRVPKELKVLSTKCWIMDFRQWLLKRGQRFPAPADVFQPNVIQFSRSSTTGGGFSREFLWRENGVVKASYVKFQVDVNARAQSQEALDYKTKWDRYIHNWNKKASPFARGAFHVSKLWVQAQAQKELMSSTVTTLAVLAVLSLFSMLAFTKDLVLSVMVVASTVWVVAGLFFFIVVVCQWPLGPIEAIALIVFIGYALTYSLHIAHLYCDKEAVPEPSTDAEGSPNSSTVRLTRTNFAVRSIGGAILGSALTTAGCTVFLLMCTLTIFLKLGAVVLVVTFLSVLASFAVMPSALLLMGPIRPGCQPDSGRVKASVQKLMAAQRALRKRSSSLLAARNNAALSSVTVSAASFVEGVMEDEPAAPPPSSHKPSLPGVGGITSAANRLASAAAVVAPQRKSPTASVSPQRSATTTPSSLTTSGPLQGPLQGPQRASPSKPFPLPASSATKPLTPPRPPTQTLQYISGVDDDLGSPSRPVEL